MSEISSPTSQPDRCGPKNSPRTASPELYINREISWLQFNERVLVQAFDDTLPLLERVKFISIFASNLDEFFMIRVSGLRQQLDAGVLEQSPDGLTAEEQLALIRRHLQPELARQSNCWHQDLVPALSRAGVAVLAHRDLNDLQQQAARTYFENDVLPTLTPLALDPGQPFPHVSNLSINLAILVRESPGNTRFARVRVPGLYPRLLRLPVAARHRPEDDAGSDGSCQFVWMEDVVAANLDLLFPHLEIAAVAAFRVTRDADQEIEADEARDLLTSIQQKLRRRQFGSVVRLEIPADAPPALREPLVLNLGLAPSQVFEVDERVGLSDVIELLAVDRPELKFEPFVPALTAGLGEEQSPFAAITRRDFLLYHPYDSFAPVTEFVRRAAQDPDVLAIKQTLYRVGEDSPIVESLALARANGKQVAVLVELKARFDEANNIVWARALEDAGVHVVYGIPGLKTHAKMCMVVRREDDRVARYLHLSTGNYNATTAGSYSDIGFFTADSVLCAEAARLFNALTGHLPDESYEQLVVAPVRMRRQIIDRIEREVASHRDIGRGYLAFKMNALVDPECIQALYRASQAGVEVQLQVRGICCLRPGVEGVSENIRVTSLVGRFLEHARMYYFRNGGDDELLLGSADLMPRNLDHRVETLFPIRNARLRNQICQRILQVHLRDTVNLRQLHSDGCYRRVRPQSAPLDSQRWMIDHRGQWDG